MVKSETFRQTWKAVADHVGNRVVTWYDGDRRRLRLTWRAGTEVATMHISAGLCWKLVRQFRWPYVNEVSPATVALLARAVLFEQAKRFFPERTAAEQCACNEVRCRRDGRLRTVARNGVCGMLLAFLFCLGCDGQTTEVPKASAAEAVPAVEVVPDYGAEKCAREGHAYIPLFVCYAGAGHYYCKRLICSRCLKKVEL